MKIFEGTYWDAWKYVINNGINSEALYPYTSMNGTGGMCRYNSSANVKPYLISYTKINPKNNTIGELIMKEALAKTGPISVGK